MDIRNIRRRTEKDWRRMGCRTYSRRRDCRVGQHFSHRTTGPRRHRPLHGFRQCVRRGQATEAMVRKVRVQFLESLQRRKLFRRAQKLQRARTLHHVATGSFALPERQHRGIAAEREARSKGERRAGDASSRKLLRGHTEEFERAPPHPQSEAQGQRGEPRRERTRQHRFAVLQPLDAPR